ncbi:MAG: hydroxyacid dehydrogenase [Phycisphaerae bacterium]|nr:hydroxyacid dehydrogenase [Phycisphaerae bacterium]
MPQRTPLKVLIADKFEESGLNELKELGYEVTYNAALNGAELKEAISESACDVLVVRSTKVTATMLDAGTRLGLVVRAGAGYDTIDVDAASKHSIFVANCPGKNAVAVAELTFALILALDRLLVENVTDLREGVWNKTRYGQARGLMGRTLGVLGVGQIGSMVIERAQAFGMNVVAWSRSLTIEQAEMLQVIRCSSPGEVASACDILTIHLPAAPETKHIVNEEVLNRLSPGSYVINTSRPELLDYKALASAIKNLELRAGLDVFPHEPASSTGKFSDSIVQASGIVYGTHHIGASTQQAQEAIASEAVRVIRVFHESGRVINCVNLRGHTDASWSLRVRHMNKPGVLAFVLQSLSEDGINVEEMENVICEGGKSACAQIKLERSLSEKLLSRLEKGNQHIIGVTQSKLRSDGVE